MEDNWHLIDAMPQNQFSRRFLGMTEEFEYNIEIVKNRLTLLLNIHELGIKQGEIDRMRDWFNRYFELNETFGNSYENMEIKLRSILENEDSLRQTLYTAEGHDNNYWLSILNDSLSLLAKVPNEENEVLAPKLKELIEQAQYKYGRLTNAMF